MDQFNQAPAPTQEEFDELNDSIPQYLTATFSNVTITTRSSSGAYYISKAIDGIPSGKRIVSINTTSWSGASASFSTNIAGTNRVEFCSDISQTVTSIDVVVLYM